MKSFILRPSSLSYEIAICEFVLGVAVKFVDFYTLIRSVLCVNSVSISADREVNQRSKCQFITNMLLNSGSNLT